MSDPKFFNPEADTLVGSNRLPHWSQREGTYCDRIVRDWEHFARCGRYIRKNPRKAKLGDGEFLVGESDLVRKLG